MILSEAMPRDVFTTLASRVRDSGNVAHRGYEDFREEEDSLTGDLGAQIRQATDGIRVTGDGGREWIVRTRIKKFRGRGDGALEKPTGADGIVQVEVLDADGNLTAAKGMLFQSKKSRASLTDADLIEQVRRMQDLVPDASAVFEYSDGGYSAVSSRDFLRSVEAHSHNKIQRVQGKKPLGDFLSDTFLACNVGVGGLYYDSHRRRLVAPDTAGGKIVSYRLDYRFFITVTPRDGAHGDARDD